MSDTDNNQPPPPQPPTTFGDYLFRLPSFMPAAFPPQRQQIQPQPQPPVQPQPQPPIQPQPQPQPPIAQPQPPALPPSGAQQTAATWALPVQSEGFQAYTPSRTRDRGWGDDDLWERKALRNNPDIVRTSHMPTPHESYPLAHGAGKQISDYSAPAVAGPAGVASKLAGIISPFMDLVGGGTFSPAFGKAQGAALANQEAQLRMQMTRMKMNREYYEDERQHMLDAIDDSQLNHKRMLLDYDRVFERFRLDKSFTREQAEEEIRQLNQEYRHQYMDGMLKTGGMAAVERHLKWEDAKYRDLGNAGATLRNSDRKRREAAGLDPNGSGLGDEWSGGGAKPGERALTGAEPGAGDEDEPAAEPKKDFSNPADEKIAKHYDLSPKAMEAAHDYLRDGTLPGKMTPKQLKDQLRNRTGDNKYSPWVSAIGDLKNVRDKIAADRSMTPEQKLEMMRQFDPATADALKGLIDYRTNPVSLGSTRKNMVTLAQQVSGGKYNEGYYHVAQKYRDPNTREGQVVDRTATLPVAVETVLDGLKEHNEAQKIPSKVFEQFKNEYYEGDPKYSKVYAGLRMFATDAIGIASGGKPPVTSVNDLLKHMYTTSSPAQIRTQMQTDAKTALAYIHNLNERWRTDTGQTDPNVLAPGVTKESMARLDAIMRMNPYTGQMPEDAPDSLKAVGKPKPTGKDRPSWLKEGQDYTPMARDDVDYWRGWLKDNPDHPRAQLIREQMRGIP